MSKPNVRSCLYALYQSNHKIAQLECQVSLEGRSADRVVPVGDDTFVYYASSPSTYLTRCQNSSSNRGRQLTGTHRLTVPPTCSIETSDYMLYRQNILYSETKPEGYQWTLPLLDFMSDDASVNDIESAVEALENTPGAPKINTESIARLNKMQRPFFLDNNFPIVTFSLSILGIVITLVIIISVAIKQRIDSQKERNARDPILRLKELMRRAENVETLEKLLEGSST